MELSPRSPRVEVTTDEDPWENVPDPIAGQEPSRTWKVDSSSRTEAAGDSVLKTPQYQRLLGTRMTLSTYDTSIQVTYKMDIPLGKEETFLASFWQHESELRQYCMDVMVCKSSDQSVKGSVRADMDVDEPETVCHACLQDGKADPCCEYIAGPLRRVRITANADDELSASSGGPSDGADLQVSSGGMTTSQGNLRTSSGSPLGPSNSSNNLVGSSLNNNNSSNNVSSNITVQVVGSNNNNNSNSNNNNNNNNTNVPLSAEALLKAESRSREGVSDSTKDMLGSSPGGVNASGSIPPSPLAKKGNRTTSVGFWEDRLSRFVERRCKTCGHVAAEHYSEGITCTYTIFMDFKTVAAWESAFPNADDILSDTMRNCIARLYEPTVSQVVDENVPETEDDSLSSVDDDLSAASESLGTLDDLGAVSSLQKEVFRVSVWKAQNMPKKADGTPHTWIVQVKFGKSVLTSSAKTSNDPVWKEHFHFKYKMGRPIFMRVLASDEPSVHIGKLKISTERMHRVRSYSSTASRGGGGGGGGGSSPPESVSLTPRRPSLALSDRHPTQDEGSGDDIWLTARQWRDIHAKGFKHGQLLVSLQMDVPLANPSLLHRVVLDAEPEGVADVLPSRTDWMLFGDIESTLQTGDVVLFVGHGWVGSTLQKYDQRPWLHMGMVMVFSEYDMILVWELTPTKSLEVSSKKTGHVRINLQMTDISTKLRDGRYYRVAIRKLVCVRTAKMLQDVLKLKKKLETDGYVRNLSDVAMAQQDEQSEEDLAASFSAELLASAYKTMGLIGEEEPLAKFTPSFWLNPEEIEFQGAKLMPPVQIERNYEPMTKTFSVK